MTISQLPKTPLGFLKLLHSREVENRSKEDTTSFAKQDDIPRKVISVLLKHDLIKGTHAYGFVVNYDKEELLEEIEI